MKAVVIKRVDDAFIASDFVEIIHTQLEDLSKLFEADNEKFRGIISAKLRKLGLSRTALHVDGYGKIDKYEHTYQDQDTDLEDVAYIHYLVRHIELPHRQGNVRVINLLEKWVKSYDRVVKEMAA